MRLALDRASTPRLGRASLLVVGRVSRLVIGCASLLVVGCASSPPCEVSAECAAGELCIDAVCVPRPDDCACVYDAECPADFECIECRCVSRCVDADGDGFVDGARCLSAVEPDCDDTDATVFPGAVEICDDGIDQDCEDGADELADCSECARGGPRECSEGRCLGVQDCDASGFWGPCVPYAAPTPEVCGNEVDDDCNGVVDDC